MSVIKIKVLVANTKNWFNTVSGNQNPEKLVYLMPAPHSKLPVNCTMATGCIDQFKHYAKNYHFLFYCNIVFS